MKKKVFESHQIDDMVMRYKKGEPSSLIGKSYNVSSRLVLKLIRPFGCIRPKGANKPRANIDTNLV